jgi:hypothetical protein
MNPFKAICATTAFVLLVPGAGAQTLHFEGVFTGFSVTTWGGGFGDPLNEPLPFSFDVNLRFDPDAPVGYSFGLDDVRAEQLQYELTRPPASQYVSPTGTSRVGLDVLERYVTGRRFDQSVFAAYPDPKYSAGESQRTSRYARVDSTAEPNFSEWSLRTAQTWTSGPIGPDDDVLGARHESFAADLFMRVSQNADHTPQQAIQPWSYGDLLGFFEDVRQGNGTIHVSLSGFQGHHYPKYGSDTYNEWYFLTMQSSDFRLTSISPVIPEPSTAALLLAGFALIGLRARAALRSKTRAHEG